jgi:GT2 family glycosyltransferase
MPRLQSPGSPSLTASQTLDREAASPGGDALSNLASKTVAVIVLTHGEYTAKYLGPCYASLTRQTYPAKRMHLFVVNNGVTERSRRLIAALAPGATVVEQRRNAGWGPGNNAGIRLALQQGYEYLVLVNVDTVLDPLWLARLVEAAQAQPDLHMLQSLILFEGTTRIQSLGNRIHFLGYGYCTGYGRDAARLTELPTMDYASGAAMLVKRQVFEAIGFFRHDYFLCYDDMEFGWRARLAGFNVGLVRGSICYHKYHSHTVNRR